MSTTADLALAGRLWAHMVSDTSVDELHAFARWLGIPDRAFQGDHYDVTDELRDCAIAEGAHAVDSRTSSRPCTPPACAAARPPGRPPPALTI